MMETQTENIPNTAFQGFLGKKEEVLTENNPHAKRYGYMAGVFSAQSDPRKTGYAFFPQGQLFGFADLESGGHYNPGYYESARNSPSKNMVITAEQCLQNARDDFQAYEEFDLGFSDFECLTGNAKAQIYFDALHPSFDEIAHNCPFGMTVCPTCRLNLLRSENVRKRAANFAEKHNLSIDILKEVRTTLIKANETLVKFYRGQWNDITQKQQQSLSNPNATLILDQSHYHWQRCIHEHTPEEKEARKIQMYGEAKDNHLANTIANALGAKTADNSEVESLRAELAEIKEMLKGTQVKQEFVRCGDSGGLNASNEPCGNKAVENGRCKLHQEA